MATSFQQPPSTKTRAGPRQGRRVWLSRRTAWFFAALLVFVVSTVIARTQAPRPDPYRPAIVLSGDWWRYPIEHNAFRRLPIITADLYDVFVLPGTDKVWAVGSGGMIVHSDDGGKTWQQQRIDTATSTEPQQQPPQQQRAPKSSGLFGVLPEAHAAVDKDAPAADPKAQQPATKQEPKRPPPLVQPPQRRLPTPPSPTSVLPLRNRDFYAVHFVDAERGWVVGDSGTILHTSDGGQRWYLQPHSFQAWLRAVHMQADGQRGWVVGDSGTILHTSDGGQRWRLQPNNSQASLWAVHMQADGQRGWIVGDEGTILYTTDAGQRWRPQPSDTQARLVALHMQPDGQRGWIVGSGGTILYTTDGGQRWSLQTSDTQTPLYGVRLQADGQRGWAVGDGGTILRTTDGGQRWNPQASGTQTRLRAVYMRTDGQHGWTVGSEGTILHTTDGGQSWNPQTSGMRAGLWSLHVQTDGQRGWVVGDNGRILRTTDGGQRWSPQTSDTQAPLYAVHLQTDGQRGWAVGRGGTILHTTDGGQRWNPQPSGTQTPLYGVYMQADGQRGWGVGWDGTILHTPDGGQRWNPQPSGTQAGLRAVYMQADGQRGWTVGSEGTILHTTDGGQRWNPQGSGTQAGLHAVYMQTNGQRGWTVGDNGTILYTADGGQRWNPQGSGTQVALRAVHTQPDGQRGWAVGDGGTILHTTDGGQRWNPQGSGTQVDLYAVHMHADGQRGWIVGFGTILLTADGGATWRPVPYSRTLAPWYYLSLLCVLLFLMPALKRPESIEASQTSVADMLISDRPLEAGDPDPLGFNAVALGLSRFLRNENTQPPLTIAITGEWGTGKSSLMNLLRADLAHNGFRPVWFNAWHHQKEEHLLASLLENIRAQAVPPWWHPRGIRFRLRLLYTRWGRFWPVTVVLLCLMALLVGYIAVDYPQRLMDLQHLVQSFTKNIDESLKSLANRELPNLKQGGSFLVVLVGLLGTVRSLWKGMQAFGVNPASLMATMSGGAHLRALKAQAGFRYQFATEFQEVTRALNPYNMVILIDDLDRCRPENVLEVLEAVNFLVSSGDCFVIMGMALDRVERCVGLHFKDVAEELLDDDALPNELAVEPLDETADEGRKKRTEFARQYLEKLINIEVPVPIPTADASRGLIVPQESKAQYNGPRLVLPRSVRRLLWAGGLAGLLVGSFLYGQHLSPPPIDRGTTPVTAVLQPAATPTDGRSTSASPDTPADRSGPATVIAPDLRGAGPSTMLMFGGLGLLLVVGLWRLSIPPDEIVKDSPEFVAALRVWHPLIVMRRNTPRAVKRFMNRVRYYAMRQKPFERTPSMLIRLLARLGVGGNGERHATAPEILETGMPEDLLVALSAVQHCHPDWLEDEELFKDFVGYLKRQEDALPEDVKDYLDDFRKGPLVAQYRQAFLRLSTGIRVL